MMNTTYYYKGDILSQGEVVGRFLKMSSWDVFEAMGRLRISYNDEIHRRLTEDEQAAISLSIIKASPGDKTFNITIQFPAAWGHYTHTVSVSDLDSLKEELKRKTTGYINVCSQSPFDDVSFGKNIQVDELSLNDFVYLIDKMEQGFAFIYAQERTNSSSENQ